MVTGPPSTDDQPAHLDTSLPFTRFVPLSQP